MKLKILDFQMARFDDDDRPGDRKSWANHDKLMLWRIVNPFGIEDDRPKPSFGILWGF